VKLAVVLAVVCALTAQAPATAPTTLPEIGRTHSKGFCSTVRDNVAPTLLGLMKTDELIGASHRALLKMAHDNSSKDALEIDRIYAGKVVVAMAHNLGVIKKLLGDEKRFPKTPASDDDRFALLLKAQLQAAAERQKLALDHVNGILDTTAMIDMRKEISLQMSGSVVPTRAATSNDLSTKSNGADEFLGASSVPGSGPGGMFEHVTAPTNMLGGTIWDKLAADVEVQQTRIAAAERTLTPTRQRRRAAATRRRPHRKAEWRSNPSRAARPSSSRSARRT
jgi:hypothetical protein